MFPISQTPPMPQMASRNPMQSLAQGFSRDPAQDSAQEIGYLDSLSSLAERIAPPVDAEERAPQLDDEDFDDIINVAHSDVMGNVASAGIGKLSNHTMVTPDDFSISPVKYYRRFSHDSDLSKTKKDTIDAKVGESRRKFSEGVAKAMLATGKGIYEISATPTSKDPKVSRFLEKNQEKINRYILDAIEGKTMDDVSPEERNIRTKEYLMENYRDGDPGVASEGLTFPDDRATVLSAAARGFKSFPALMEYSSELWGYMGSEDLAEREYAAGLMSQSWEEGSEIYEREMKKQLAKYHPDILRNNARRQQMSAQQLLQTFQTNSQLFKNPENLGGFLMMAGMCPVFALPIAFVLLALPAILSATQTHRSKTSFETADSHKTLYAQEKAKMVANRMVGDHIQNILCTLVAEGHPQTDIIKWLAKETPKLQELATTVATKLEAIYEKFPGDMKMEVGSPEFREFSGAMKSLTKEVMTALEYEKVVSIMTKTKEYSVAMSAFPALDELVGKIRETGKGIVDNVDKEIKKITTAIQEAEKNKAPEAELAKLNEALTELNKTKAHPDALKNMTLTGLLDILASKTGREDFPEVNALMIEFTKTHPDFSLDTVRAMKELLPEYMRTKDDYKNCRNEISDDTMKAFLVPLNGENADPEMIVKTTAEREEMVEKVIGAIGTNPQACRVEPDPIFESILENQEKYGVTTTAIGDKLGENASMKQSDITKFLDTFYEKGNTGHEDPSGNGKKCGSLKKEEKTRALSDMLLRCIPGAAFKDIQRLTSVLRSGKLDQKTYAETYDRRNQYLALAGIDVFSRASSRRRTTDPLRENGSGLSLELSRLFFAISLTRLRKENIDNFLDVLATYSTNSKSGKTMLVRAFESEADLLMRKWPDILAEAEKAPDKNKFMAQKCAVLALVGSSLPDEHPKKREFLEFTSKIQDIAVKPLTEKGMKEEDARNECGWMSDVIATNISPKSRQQAKETFLAVRNDLVAEHQKTVLEMKYKSDAPYPGDEPVKVKEPVLQKTTILMSPGERSRIESENKRLTDEYQRKKTEYDNVIMPEYTRKLRAHESGRKLEHRALYEMTNETSNDPMCRAMFMAHFANGVKNFITVAWNDILMMAPTETQNSEREQKENISQENKQPENATVEEAYEDANDPRMSV